MDSQESDLYPSEWTEDLLRGVNVNSITEIDFSNINVPENHQAISADSSPTGHMPLLDQWTGPYLFSAAVDTSGVHKKAYVMSHKLNKLFVDIEKTVPVKISWDNSPDLFVRAIMVFTQADNKDKPVKRCITHRDETHNLQRDYKHFDHVLACATPGAIYEKDAHSGRFSVVVPLGRIQEGTDYVLLSYKFMCKTSCPGGINRALTDVIFTLEDKERTVLGRQSLSVRVCSCPKRDKDNEEESLGNPPGKKKTKKPVLNNPAPAKKIKLETTEVDDEPVTFTVTVKGRQNAEELKQYIRCWDFFKVSKRLNNLPNDMSTVEIHDSASYS